MVNGFHPILFGDILSTPASIGPTSALQGQQISIRQRASLEPVWGDLIEMSQDTTVDAVTARMSPKGTAQIFGFLAVDTVNGNSVAL
jgi:hypothetical protein